MKQRKNSKENTPNLFKRYVWLVEIIYRRGKITFEEIDKKWQKSFLNINGSELPLRTFHNHRIAIEQMFDISIVCDKHDGFRYYIENGNDIERDDISRWLLSTFAVNNLINESNRLKHRILFEKIPKGQNYLTTIIEAMLDSLSIEITYQSFWQDSSDTFEIYPYCIKVFKQRWYLIAYMPYKSKIVIHALDRVKKMSVTENNFQMPKDFDGEEYFYDSFGIFAGEDLKVEKVLIKAYKNKDSYIKALPLHHSQKEDKSTSEYTVFSYNIKPTYDFRQEILSHGDEVEVLSPQWFRNEIIDIIKEQYKIYRK